MTDNDFRKRGGRPGNETTRLTRRTVIARLAALGLAVPGATTLAARNARAGLQAATPTAARAGLVQRGINYDTCTLSTGMSGLPDYLSREAWTDGAIATAAMQDEIGVIATDLHCTAVSLLGSDVARLAEGATMALEQGLSVWLQPRLMGAAAEETPDLVTEVARAGEATAAGRPERWRQRRRRSDSLHRRHHPGDSFEERVASLISAGDQLGEFYQNLNDYLEQATSAARAVFAGDLIYSAGPWEWGAVDWSRFNFVGLDHYRDASNEATYVDELRAIWQHGKPIIVTEFGCCCYDGAEERGGDGYAIIDCSAPLPELDGAYVRSERVQADYIAELLAIFAAEVVHGAFVWTFIEESPHSPDPRYDLDMACFGIVKVVPDSGYPPPPGVEFTPPGPGDWEPKLAFDELARLYAAP